MSSSYTPTTNTFHSTITVTSDGDNANLTAFNTAPQMAADNAAYLNANLSPLISGGTISPTGTLNFALGTGHFFSVNSSLGVSSTADGGKVSISGENGCEISFSLTVDHSITTAALTTAALTTTGTVTMTDGATISGSILACEAGAVINGAFTVNGRSAMNDRILCNGGIRFRPLNLGTISTNQTQSVDNADIFLVSDSSVSTLDFKVVDPTVTTAEDGITIWVVSHATNSLVIKNQAGVALTTLSFASGQPYAVMLTRIDGTWILTGESVKA